MAGLCARKRPKQGACEEEKAWDMDSKEKERK